MTTRCVSDFHASTADSAKASCASDSLVVMASVGALIQEGAAMSLERPGWTWFHVCLDFPRPTSIVRLLLHVAVVVYRKVTHGKTADFLSSQIVISHYAQWDVQTRRTLQVSFKNKGAIWVDSENTDSAAPGSAASLNGRSRKLSLS